MPERTNLVQLAKFKYVCILDNNIKVELDKYTLIENVFIFMIYILTNLRVKDTMSTNNSVG